MNVSAASSMSAIGASSGQISNIDKQIELLNKRKTIIAQKMVAVARGDDDKKLKDEKIRALTMEINAIDMQINQLIKKKMELKENKNDPSKANSSREIISLLI